MAQWFRHDVGLVGHPKLAHLDTRQLYVTGWLYVALLEYVTEYETDGWVAAAGLRAAAQVARVARPGVVVERLVDVGLLHAVDLPDELELTCARCANLLRSCGEVVVETTASLSRKPQVRSDRRLGETAFFYLHGYLERQQSADQHDHRRLQGKGRTRDYRERRQNEQMRLGGDGVTDHPPAGSGDGVTAPPRDAPTEQTEDLKALSSETLNDARETGNPEDRLTAGAQANQLRAAVNKLTGADRGTYRQLEPLLAELTDRDVDQLLAEAQAAPLTNQAGLLRRRINDHLAEQRRTTARRIAAGQPPPDTSTARQHELTPAERIEAYAASLARHEPGLTVTASIDTIARRLAPQATDGELTDLIATGIAAHEAAHHAATGQPLEAA